MTNPLPAPDFESVVKAMEEAHKLINRHIPPPRHFDAALRPLAPGGWGDMMFRGKGEERRVQELLENLREASPPVFHPPAPVFPIPFYPYNRVPEPDAREGSDMDEATYRGQTFKPGDIVCVQVMAEVVNLQPTARVSTREDGAAEAEGYVRVGVREILPPKEVAQRPRSLMTVHIRHLKKVNEAAVLVMADWLQEHGEERAAAMLRKSFPMSELVEVENGTGDSSERGDT